MRKYSDIFNVLKENNCQAGKIYFTNEGEIKVTLGKQKQSSPPTDPC